MRDQDHRSKYAELTNGSLTEEANDPYYGIIGNNLESVGRASTAQSDANSFFDGKAYRRLDNIVNL